MRGTLAERWGQYPWTPSTDYSLAIACSRLPEVWRGDEFLVRYFAFFVDLVRSHYKFCQKITCFYGHYLIESATYGKYRG
jgi:hypothetical protein